MQIVNLQYWTNGHDQRQVKSQHVGLVKVELLVRLMEEEAMKYL